MTNIEEMIDKVFGQIGDQVVGATHPFESLKRAIELVTNEYFKEGQLSTRIFVEAVIGAPWFYDFVRDTAAHEALVRSHLGSLAGQVKEAVGGDKETLVTEDESSPNAYEAS